MYQYMKGARSVGELRKIYEPDENKERWPAADERIKIYPEICNENNSPDYFNRETKRGLCEDNRSKSNPQIHVSNKECAQNTKARFSSKRRQIWERMIRRSKSDSQISKDPYTYEPDSWNPEENSCTSKSDTRMSDVERVFKDKPRAPTKYSPSASSSTDESTENMSSLLTYQHQIYYKKGENSTSEKQEPILDYAEARTVENVLQKLEKESFVIIIGNPGDWHSKLANICAMQCTESSSNTILLTVNRSYKFSAIKKMKNYVILVEGPFNQIDPDPEIEYILREVQENAQNRQNRCKMVVVMLKEALTFVKTYFRNMEWLRNDVIIDVSFDASKKRLLGALKDHLTDMNGISLLLLGAIALNDGSLSFQRLCCTDQEDVIWNNVSVFVGMPFHSSRTKLLFKTANALKGIYIAEKSNSYVFLNQDVSDAVHISLFKQNRWKYVELCPLSKLSILSKEYFKEQLITEIFEKRIIREMKEKMPRIEIILKLNIWQEDVVRRIGPELVKSFLSLKCNDRRIFLQGLRRSKNIALLSYFFIVLPNLRYNKLERKIVLETWTTENSKNLSLCREQTMHLKSWPVDPAGNYAGSCDNLVCILTSDFIWREFEYFSGTHTMFSECMYPAREFIVYMARKRKKDEVFKMSNDDSQILERPITLQSESKTLSKLLYGLIDDRSKNYRSLLLEIGKELKEEWYIQRAVFQARTDFMTSIYPSLNKSEECFLTSKIDEAVKRRFKALNKNLTFLQVWTGTYYQQGEKKSRGIDTIVGIVKCKQTSTESTFWGLDVIIREENEFCEEALDVMFHSPKYSNQELIELSGQTYSDLLRMHSNITLISTSSVKSRNYEKKNASIVYTQCVVIYCQVKGIIPTGEDAFPEKIENHPVDVREGFCNFAVNEIRAGDKITSEKEGTGTLGGFVDCEGSRKNAFITCAHVLYAREELGENLEKMSIKTERNVLLSVNDAWHEIGRVKCAVFNNSQEEDSSVDAALVDMTDFSFTNDGQFSETYSKKQLKRAGMHNERSISFTSGKTEMINSSTINKKVMKVGAESGLTVGKVTSTCTSKTPIHNQDRSLWFNLFNQIEVQPLSRDHSPFLKSGDSGSFIFIFEEDNPRDLKCVGMAVASTSYGSCIMTPIHRVLNALNLHQNSLSSFVNPFESEETRYVTENKLSSVIQDQTDMMRNVLENVKIIKTEIEKLSKRVENVEEKVENNLNNFEKKSQDPRN